MRKDTTFQQRVKTLTLIRFERPDRPIVENYAERHVDSKIVVVPYVGTNRGEILAEELVEHSLPLCYRDLLWPGNLRAHSVVTLQRPSDVVDRYHRLQVLRALDACEKRLTKPRRARRAS